MHGHGGGTSICSVNPPGEVSAPVVASMVYVEIVKLKRRAAT